MKHPEHAAPRNQEPNLTDVAETLTARIGPRWSFETEPPLTCTEAGGEVLVKGRLTAVIHDQTVVMEQYGRQRRTQQTSWGEAVQAAGTDALQRCAALMGWGRDDSGWDNRYTKEEETSLERIRRRVQAIAAHHRRLRAEAERN